MYMDNLCYLFMVSYNYTASRFRDLAGGYKTTYNIPLIAMSHHEGPMGRSGKLV